ncbi:MAG: Phosphoribosylglycinamide formyltransferase [Elusimicrobia bacterium]|nr:Phosphoribosylglycinamide formyltransferase [Elusimicrobiota bacterium]
MSEPKKRIAVMASGNGSNFQALIDACASGEINGDLVALVSNQRYAYALTRARAANIEPLLFESAKFKTRTLMCSKISQALKERKVDLVCLAGYMSKIEPCLVRSFPNRILNIHPALLPKYGGKGMYGRHVHEAVIAGKEKESGCTIHLVNEVYDEGPILAQLKVAVDPSDTPESLAEKILPLEHQLYVSVVKDVCSGKINLDKYAEVTP